MRARGGLIGALGRQERSMISLSFRHKKIHDRIIDSEGIVIGVQVQALLGRPSHELVEQDHAMSV